MDKVNKATRLMNMIRIIAVVLIIASAVLYFTAKEYALYPAIAGFALIAFINLPLNVWLAFQREKTRKAERDKYEAERKERGPKADKDVDNTGADKTLHYSDRKSGLSWGGGNVHAANAKRKPRKKFLGK